MSINLDHKVLEIKNLSILYGNRIAVNNISFDVKEGDILGIVGPNGAGKTTLFRSIFGLCPYKGTISLFGYDHKKYKSSLLTLIGYVPQKIDFESNFPATVYDIVSMGTLSDKKVAKGIRLAEKSGFHFNQTYKKINKTEDKVMKALKTVDIDDLKDRRIGELSAGQLQRVFIAKSLINDPPILILDEPVTSVDVESQTKFYNVIKKINKENEITIIWSSHDLEAIEKYANRVACMNKDLFFHGEKEKFFSDEKYLKTYTESAMQIHMHDHAHNFDSSN
jgi:zinc transport system ATP-binding protein